jgi:hypothetical protein
MKNFFRRKELNYICIFIVVCCFFLTATGEMLFAFTPEGLDNEADVGLAAESVPTSGELDIPTLTIKGIDGEPVIDGNLDDDFWTKAQKLDLQIELYPERLSPAVVETKAYVAATKTHLYVAFDASDPNVEEIRSALRERDASKEDDYVSIIIDPTGSMARKFEFRVNPDGTLSDVLQDVISDRYIYDWDTAWVGAAIRSETGYSVELAIPADALYIPSEDTPDENRGVVILKRSYPRSVDRVLATFFYFERGKSDTGESADSLSSVSGEEPDERDIPYLPKKLSVRPHYIYHLDEARDIGGEFEQEEDTNENSIGIDAKYKISTSKSLAMTINPNFSEVEADIAKQSISNPFTIFQPEKRTFFQSATEYFSSLIPVVYTRNIIRPRGGLAYLNDSGSSSFAAFATDDRETEVIVPDSLGSDNVELLESSYSGAFRYRSSKERHTSGLTGTYRAGEGYYNATLNYDGLFDLGPDDKFRYQLSYSGSEYPQSFAEDLCEEDGCTEEVIPDPCLIGDCSVNAEVLRTDYGNRLNGHNVQLRYKHDGPKGLYWVGYQDIADGYRADLGFVRQVDIRDLNFAYGKKWYLKTLADDDGKSRVRSYIVGKYMRSYHDNDLLEKAISFWGEFRGTYQSVVRVGYRYRDRAVNRIDQGSLAVGDNAPLFEENYVQWYMETSPHHKWKINFDGRVGDIADADNLVLGFMVELEPAITFRYGPFEFTVGGTFRDYEYDGSMLWTEQFLSFTTLYRSSKKFSHRLLYLDNVTKRDAERWIDDELPREEDWTFEYTFTYQPKESLRFLTGIKLEHEYESDIDDGDITGQQFYCKIEKSF